MSAGSDKATRGFDMGLMRGSGILRETIGESKEVAKLGADRETNGLETIQIRLTGVGNGRNAQLAGPQLNGQLLLQNGISEEMKVGKEVVTIGLDIRPTLGSGIRLEINGESEDINKFGVGMEITGHRIHLTQLNGDQTTALLQPLDRRTGVANGKSIQVAGHLLSGLLLLRSGISKEVKVGKREEISGFGISQTLGNGTLSAINGQSEDISRCGDEMEITGFRRMILTQLSGAQNTLLQLVNSPATHLQLVSNQVTGVVSGKSIQLAGALVSGLLLQTSGISEEFDHGKRKVTRGSVMSQILGSGIHREISGQFEDMNRYGVEMETTGDELKFTPILVVNSAMSHLSVFA